MEPCPEIDSGQEAVVTGHFRHEVKSGEVIELLTSDSSRVVRVTPAHRYWSADRHDFVEAGELRIGEHLSTVSGTATVVSLTRHPYSGVVFNLETTEHVYRVGDGGVLVHNGCAGPELVDGVDKDGKFWKATLSRFSPQQKAKIQDFANKYGVDVIVTGSRARGNINQLSDWDYIIRGGNSNVRGKVGEFLPKGVKYDGPYGRTKGFDVIDEGSFDPTYTHIIFSPGQ